MGWFDEQIRLRKQSDQEIFEDSIFRMASTVLGGRGAGALNDRRIVAKAAIDEILKYYRIKPAEIPEDITDLDGQLEYCLRPHGIMRRSVRLAGKWYTDAFGPMLGFLKESARPVALLPRSFSGYWFADPDTGEKVRLDARRAQLFDKLKAKGDHLRVADLHDVDVVCQHVDHRDNLVALAVVDGELKLHS